MKVGCKTTSRDKSTGRRAQSLLIMHAVCRGETAELELSFELSVGLLGELSFDACLNKLME